MIPRRIMQGAVEKISRQYGCSLAVFDLTGQLMSSAGGNVKSLPADELGRFANSHKQRGRIGGTYVIKIASLSEPVMIAAVYDAEDGMATGSVELALSLLLYHQRGRFDTEEFLRQLFSGVIAPSEVLACAGELGLDKPCKRLVYAIAFESERSMVLTDHLCRSLEAKLSEIVMIFGSTRLLVIHEALPQKEKEKAARRRLEQTVSEKIGKLTDRPARIGCGCYAEDIGSLRRSYEEAVAAIETGRVFDPQKRIHRYEDLLIEHLVRHLPRTFRQWFLKHTFSERFFDELDEEMEKTATIFLDNTMNAAETSRQLYYHRNTLYYRLDIIKEKSGLNLREFKDASVFRLGWAMHRYDKNSEVKDSEEML